MELINSLDETFKFDDKTIRVVGSYNEPWFVAKDISDILGLTNISESVKNIPDKCKQIKNLVSVSLISGFSNQEQGRNMIIINESGLYRLIARSNKPIAQKFQDEVFDKILPSLRLKGQYTIQSIVDKNKELEEEKMRFEKENLILEHKLQQEKQLLQEKNKDLLANTVDLYSLSRTHDKILRKRKRTAYDIGNVVYIISNEAFNSHYGNLYYKIGKATQGSNENRSAFTDRLSNYNTGTPKNYTVHYICYVEQNDVVEKMIKIRFRKNLDESNKEEWLLNTSLETIITFVREQCNNMDLSFEEKIIGEIENIQEIKEEPTDEETNEDETKGELKSNDDVVKKECLSHRLYNNFHQPKKTVRAIGNIVYIISNDSFGDYYKIDKETQNENENIAEFTYRLSKYNKSAPKDYNVHYICYVEQNELIMKLLKINFKEEWISNISLSKIISCIRELCETMNFSFEEKVFDKMKLQKEQKIEKEIQLENKVELENKNEFEMKETNEEIHLDIVEQYSTDLSKLQGFCRKLGISQKGICSDLYDRIIHFIKTGEEKPYRTLEELRKICKEYDLIYTGNKDVLEDRIKYYLETGNKVRYVKNIEEEKEIVVEESDIVPVVSFEKDYIMQNIDNFTSEKLTCICNLYKLNSNGSNDIMKQKIRNFFDKGIKESDRRKDVYQYDKNGIFIKHYNSITEAKNQINICGNVIANALNKNCMVNDFIFRNIHVDFSKNDLKEISKNSTKFKKQLTTEDHDKIKKMFNDGETKQNLMDLYSISRTQINRIIRK
jgi:prophage antirepressor-like protein